MRLNGRGGEVAVAVWGGGLRGQEYFRFVWLGRWTFFFVTGLLLPPRGGGAGRVEAERGGGSFIVIVQARYHSILSIVDYLESPIMPGRSDTSSGGGGGCLPGCVSQAF